MNIRDHRGLQGDGSGGNRLEFGGSRTPANVPQQVHVEIDELVLTGFSRSEGQEIAESVRETLRQLFAGDVACWSEAGSMQVDNLDAGRVQMRRSGRAQSTGDQVARAIYRSLPR